MNIVNVRIDERLIHAQVAASWSNTLKATRIMVIDDLSSSDDVTKMTLKMAAPMSVKLSILSVEKAVDRLQAKAYENENIFMILKSPKTACRMVELGWTFDSINVANMSLKDDSTMIKKSLYVLPEDMNDFNFLINKGIHLYTQTVPTEESEDFLPLIQHLAF